MKVKLKTHDHHSNTRKLRRRSSLLRIAYSSAAILAVLDVWRHQNGRLQRSAEGDVQKHD